jgi:predicted lipoprotein with Yx(FWY)xxD motif
MHPSNHQRANSGEAVSGIAWRRVIAALLAAALAILGLLAAGSIARSATRSGATVSLRKTSLGMILAAKNGHTLYLFAKDRKGKSACTASCAQFWPPLLSKGKPVAGAGVKASLLGTTKRSNGTLQVTYNKHPLYTYVVDKRAGQAKGDGVAAFGAKWYALGAKGTAIVKAPAKTTTSPYP